MVNRRLTALVVGIANYRERFSLDNPVNDAEDISQVLEEIGFSVTTLINVDIASFEDAISSFRDNLNSSDVGLFYFAGHGFEIQGQNYIATLSADFSSPAGIKYGSYSLSKLIDEMSDCLNLTNIIILDACRNNPFTSDRSGRNTNTFASLYAPKGTFIAYSTSPGQISRDGVGRNGAYTEALLRHLATEDISIEEVFKRTRNTLASITNDQQTSWEHTSLTDDFMFNVSIVNRIPNTIYERDALSDKDFIVNKDSIFGKIMIGLKSYNYYRQNPEILKLTCELLSSFSLSELFVLGRNIYQSSVGGSSEASNFIENFRSKVTGLDTLKQKALLDGMLFEIFFDSSANLRQQFKFSKFNLVFGLQNFPELNGSFAFIADVLTPYFSKFYQIPGRQNPINIDIITYQNEEQENIIDEIRLSGNNILKLDGSKSKESWEADPKYYPVSLRKLKNTLSEELVIPLEFITINLIPNPTINSKHFLYPSHHTVMKY